MDWFSWTGVSCLYLIGMVFTLAVLKRMTPSINYNDDESVVVFLAFIAWYLILLICGLILLYDLFKLLLKVED